VLDGCVSSGHPGRRYVPSSAAASLPRRPSGRRTAAGRVSRGRAVLSCLQGVGWLVGILEGVAG
jgi:hypothetical protein